jgi:primary-amine oxidase
VLVTFEQGSKVMRARVDVTAEALTQVAAIPGVKTGITSEDWMRATVLVKQDERWRAAMRRRGISNFDDVFCDALSVGAQGASEPARLLKVPCYDATDTTNVYGRPIEGVIGLVDLTSLRVVEVSDSGIEPLSKADPSLEEERQPTLRSALKPVFSTAPEGWNFSFDGGMVTWATWSFHLAFNQRLGPVISTVRYDDHGRERPILYQGHVSEMFVPYMDSDPNWTFRSYMDVGEYGFGSSASELVEGADCPPGAVMLSAVLANAAGQPYTAKNVMCGFERNTTSPLWRRSEVITGAHEARQDIEFVIRTIPTVGNYDYVYDWVFNQKGEIRIDIGATGIMAAKGVDAATAGDMPDNVSGVLVAPNIAAPFHDHFISFRLDLDVDGRQNRVVRDTIATRPEADRNGRSFWGLTTEPRPDEFAAGPSHQPVLFRVESSGSRTALGHTPSFEIAYGHGATSLLSPEDPTQKRAAFSASSLWVTRYDPAERHAAGDFPNQSQGGEGLPRYVDGQGIVDDDIVVWPTMGFHHLTRPEDWPVLPTVQHSITLRPNRFFDRNPSVDLQGAVSAPAPAP